jgi:hypothetical protein
LLVGFTGEHVGEPRVLICLYGPPVLHVDLKFGKSQLGLRPAGVRRLEAIAPELASELKGTAAAPEAGSILAAIRVCVDLYRRMRSAHLAPILARASAEAAAIEYVAEIERRCAARGDQ